MTPMEAVLLMPKEQRAQLIEDIQAKLSVLPESIVTQTSTLYTKGE